MVQNEITFENLPKAVAHLVSEIAEIKNLVCKGQKSIALPKRIPIGIDDACKLIWKAKPTVYTLVRKRLLPCYKNGKQNLVHSRHRSIHNFLMNLCSALATYCFFENKPEALPVYVEKRRQLDLF